MSRAVAHPVGLRPADPDQAGCAACLDWSPWATGLGDCMRYSRVRTDALVVDDDPSTFAARWPALSARDTEATDRCDDWKAKP